MFSFYVKINNKIISSRWHNWQILFVLSFCSVTESIRMVLTDQPDSIRGSLFICMNNETVDCTESCRVDLVHDLSYSYISIHGLNVNSFFVYNFESKRDTEIYLKPF